MPHESTESGQATIAYDRTGGGAPSMVFIHGLTYDRRMWSPVIEKLTDNYTCVNIDLPGHGKSSDAENYNFLAVTGNIHELVERLELEKPIMIGHSLGGVIAAIYASMYPTSGLVISDQMLRTTGFLERLQGIREQLQNPSAFPQIWRSIESQLRIDLIPEQRRKLVQGEASNPRQEVVLGYWREGLYSSPKEMEERTVQAIHQIKVPFTAIFGEDVDPDYREWLSANVPQCKVVVFPNAGHFPHLVNPDRFAAEVRGVAAQSKSGSKVEAQ